MSGFGAVVDLSVISVTLKAQVEIPNNMTKVRQVTVPPSRNMQRCILLYA